MIERMKFTPDPDTTPQQKMARFQSALGCILSRSKEDLNQLEVEDERIRRLRKGKPGPKPSSASGHVSGKHA
jgi:hypothetical protein